MTDRTLTRLARLEKENILLRIGMLAVLALTISLIGIAAAPTAKVYKTLKTEKLVVGDIGKGSLIGIGLDTDGSINLVMSTADKMPILAAADTKGEGVFYVTDSTLSEEGDNQSGAYVTNAKENGCGLHILNASEEDVIVLADDETSPGLAMADAKGTPRFAAGLGEDDWSILCLLGTDGKSVTSMISVMPGEDSMLALGRSITAKDEEAVAGVVLIANEAEAGTSASITDTKGKGRAFTGCSTAGEPALVLFDAAEKVRFSASVSKELNHVQLIDEDRGTALGLYDTPDGDRGLAWSGADESIIKTINAESKE